MKTNEEMQALLNMVAARLSSYPSTEAEWIAIVRALSQCSRYAIARRFECKAKEDEETLKRIRGA